MKKTLRIGMVQLASDSNWQRNMDMAISLLNEGVKKGAQLLTLPEVFNIRNAPKSTNIAEEIPGKSLKPLMAIAKKHQVYINIGSICETVGDGGLPYNTSAMINSAGEISSIYRKMHLFDCHLEDKSILESEKYQSGDTPVIATMADLKIGMSICYDLRFPELYRYYSAHDCKLLLAPASFIKPTGVAHWEVLVRARAIENLSFMIATNQAGIGAGGVQTYGNSMVVNPWGEVLARGSLDREELIMADLDFNLLDNCRKKLPALGHRRI